MSEDSLVTKQRREMIRQIVSSSKISTQEQLVARLEEQGMHTTQSTVSRDIRELRLKKTGPAGARCYFLPASRPKPDLDAETLLVFKNVVRRIDQTLNQVIIHTTSGMAPGLAAMLDRQRWPEILGTLAGDDTLLIITKTPETAAEVTEALTGL